MTLASVNHYSFNGIVCEITFLLNILVFQRLLKDWREGESDPVLKRLSYCGDRSLVELAVLLVTSKSEQSNITNHEGKSNFLITELCIG